MREKPESAKILVVEDDRTVREYLQELLSAKGYSVCTATGIEEVIRLLSEDQFPVIVTDLQLRGRSGLEILDYVQKNNLPTAVLIVTAFGSMESVIEALRRGAYDYIPKPFSSGILLHRTARAVEKIRMDEENRNQNHEMASLLEMTRDLSSKIVYATEVERQRISRDLHDGIGQSLSIIKLTLKALRHKFLVKEKDLIQELDNLSNLVEETLDDVSRISKDMSPSYVNEMGFLQTLRLFLETFSKKTGIRIQSHLPDTFVFPHPQHEVHLYRIVQEALTNIAKHASATHVDIFLEPMKDSFYVAIKDNGIGFSENQGERVGLGLIGMRERATFLGGKLRIESAPGRGTTIRAEIPYEPPLSISRS